MRPRLGVPLAGAIALLPLLVPSAARAQRDTTARAVRFCAGGDVTLGTNLDRWWRTIGEPKLMRKWRYSPDPDSLLAPLAPLVRDADVLMLNVEGAIGDGRTPSKCGPKSTSCFALRMPAAVAPSLRRLAPRATMVANLANNHSRDAGVVGGDTTRAVLERAGILVTGLDSMATPLPTPRGDTIGVIGFYTIRDTLGTIPDARDLAAVERHVARAVERWGTVVVTMHIGGEGRGAQRTRNRTERYLNLNRGNPVGFADAAFAGGATLVVGHGPHVMRAAEWREDRRLALYSLGNLVTYGPFIMKEPLNRGAIACVDLGSARIARAELRPTVQLAPGLVRPDASRRAATLVDSLSRLDFPKTAVRVALDGTLEQPRARERTRVSAPAADRKSRGRRAP